MNAAPFLRPSTKGEETRAQILEAAVQMASEGGFEALTIGSLAEKTGLSKSGLFAHFGSKLDLQIATLDEAARRFTEAVFQPALKVPRGLKRLGALFEGWVDWPGRASLKGCPLNSASEEYNHQPGPMRDAVMERQRLLERELAKAARMAVDAGELDTSADTSQIAFEMVGIVLSYYRCEQLMGHDVARQRALTAYSRLIDSARPHAAAHAAARR
jgi:AcrR family transcriptional regulator